MAKKITIKIGGMECPNCAMILERIEDKLPGIIMAEASYHKEQMVVEYNEQLLSDSRIREEIHKMGYEVTEVRPSGK